MEISNHELSTLQLIDQILVLPREIEEIVEDQKEKAYIGSYKHVTRMFHRLPIAEGWGTYGPALKNFGAIIAVKYRKLVMINTDVIPSELIDFVLEHEAVESALGLDELDKSHSLAVEKIRKLKLIEPIQSSSKIRWNHVFATIRQFRLAQKNGQLDEMMEFANDLESRPKNMGVARGNSKARQAIYSLLHPNLDKELLSFAQNLDK